MGALSVVICAILSSIFLKERLTFFGKVGCFLCIVGATIIALNGPEEQAVTTIKEVSRPRPSVKLQVAETRLSRSSNFTSSLRAFLSSDR